MKKLLFIYNPHAGKGRIPAQLHNVIQVFQSHGYLTTLYATQGQGDGVWAAAALGGDYDRVVCCGGDGTLSEVVTGLHSLERMPLLGYLPAGTTNDFSKTLELPSDLSEAAELAVKAGAIRESVEIIDVEDVPLQYYPGNTCRVKVKAAGDLA